MKHGYGVVFQKQSLFGKKKLDNCINDVVQFVVKDDKYANISNLIFADDIEL